jgi:microcystin-dependent protein
VSYPNDNLSDDIDALVSGASSLGVAASSVGTISNGSDVVVENFAGLQSALSGLSAFLSELKSGHFYTPVGALMPFAGVTSGSNNALGDGWVPSGWIACNGQTFVAAGASADLQSLLVAAGFGDIPDLRGRTIFGVGTNAAVDVLGDSDGIATVANRRPQHKHTASSNTTGAHTHSISHTDQGYASQNSGNGSTFIMGNLNGYNNFGAGVNLVANSNGNHSHTITVGDQTTGTPTDVVPYLTLNYIIKN